MTEVDEFESTADQKAAQHWLAELLAQLVARYNDKDGREVYKQLMAALAAHEAEAVRRERAAIFDHIYHLAPKDQFMHWDKHMIANFFTALSEYERELKG